MGSALQIFRNGRRSLLNQDAELGQSHAHIDEKIPTSRQTEGTRTTDNVEDIIIQLQTKCALFTKENELLLEKLEQAKVKRKTLRSQMKSLNAELEQGRQEKEVLLKRLSEIAGTKLVDNNPNITDLSDENRATKLAEQFSELYDNQWTDAYTMLTEEHNLPEETAILSLFEITEKLYNDLRRLSEKHLQHLRKSVSKFLLDVAFKDEELQTVQKNLKDLRKRKAQYAVDILLTKLDRTLTEDTPLNKVYTCLKDTDFFRKSVQILWMMAVQDPPLALCFDRQTGEEFNKDKYKPYTIDGDIILYIVWPALYLYDGGPLLCKGVAQGDQPKITHGQKRKARGNNITVSQANKERVANCKDVNSKPRKLRTTTSLTNVNVVDSEIAAVKKSLRKRPSSASDTPRKASPSSETKPSVQESGWMGDQEYLDVYDARHEANLVRT